MTSKVQHITGEPTIILEFDDSADEQSVITAYTRSLEFVSNITGPVYRIVDVQHAPSSYLLIIETIQHLVQGIAGAAIAPQIAIAFVGKPNMSHPDITFFSSTDNALAEARSKFAETVISL